MRRRRLKDVATHSKKKRDRKDCEFQIEGLESHLAFSFRDVLNFEMAGARIDMRKSFTLEGDEARKWVCNSDYPFL